MSCFRQSVIIIACFPVVLQLWLYQLETSCGLAGSRFCHRKSFRTTPDSCHQHTTQWRIQCHPFASRGKSVYRHSASDAGSYRRFLCYHVLSCIVANWTELFLALAPHKTSLEQVVLYLLRLSAESKAQGFQRVELFVTQKHVDTRYEYGRVFRQIIHRS